VEYRKIRGISQQEIASKLGMTQVNYSRFETGKTSLTVERLVKIARILNIDLIKLLFPDFNMAKQFEDLKNQNQLLRENNELLFEQLQDKKILIEILSQLYPEIRDLLQNKADYTKYRLENKIPPLSDFTEENNIHLPK